MDFRTCIPGSALRPFVDHFWLVRTDDTPFPRQRLFPDGGVTVLFNFGVPQGLVDVEGGETEVFRDCWISGERTRPYVLESPSGSHLAGIRFRPGGAAAFFNLPLSELTDRVVPLEVLLGASVMDVHHALRDPVSPAAVFAGLDGFLLERFDAGRAPSRRVIGALDLLSSPRATRITSLAADVGSGERRLHREFERTVGIRPKLVHRIMRFQRVIAMEDGRDRVDWTRIALRCGYYDQAHLIRDFRRFTGTTPSAYRQHRLEYPNYLPEL